jgi:hypothetical protein
MRKANGAFTGLLNETEDVIEIVIMTEQHFTRTVLEGRSTAQAPQIGLVAVHLLELAPIVAAPAVLETLETDIEIETEIQEMTTGEKKEVGRGLAHRLGVGLLREEKRTTTGPQEL